MNDPYPFRDRRELLFGRQRDIAYLHERVDAPGLTVVRAQHQAGKSWLLEEFGRLLDNDGLFSVGWVQAAGPSPDLTLNAITDLYKRWLSVAHYVEQARVVWSQTKRQYLRGTARAFGELADGLLDAASFVPVGKAISLAIGGLNEANATLKSSGMDLPRLKYGEAKELVRLVVELGKKPAVLILDALDEAESIQSEASMFRHFLSQIDDWPHLHVIVSLYPSGSAFNSMRGVVRSLAGPAQIYDLPPMNFDDHVERARFLAYLRAMLPLATDIPDDELLSLVDGHPGVIFRWCRGGGYHRTRMKSRADLLAVAKGAHTYRFDELHELLPALTDAQFRSAIRLSLLPPFSTEAWGELGNVVLADESPSLLDDLVSKQVLESAAPPNFGHGLRHIAARDWFVQSRAASCRVEVEGLVSDLARLARGDASDVIPAWGIAGLDSTAKTLLPNELPSSIATALSLTFAGDAEAPRNLLGALSAVTVHDSPDAELESLARLTAITTSQVLGSPEVYETNPHTRDELLSAMVKLSERFDRDEIVANQAAGALFGVAAESRKRGDFTTGVQHLKVLRALHQRISSEQTQLALSGSLLNAFSFTLEIEGYERAAPLLEELAALAESAKETALWEQVAAGLRNVLVSQSSVRPAVSDQAVDRLRAIVDRHPTNRVLRLELTKGLVARLASYGSLNDHERLKTTFDELQSLAKPLDDPEFALRLVKGFYHILTNLPDLSVEDSAAYLDAMLELTKNFAGVNVADRESGEATEWLALRAEAISLEISRRGPRQPLGEDTIGELLNLPSSTAFDRRMFSSIAWALHDLVTNGTPHRVHLERLKSVFETVPEDSSVQSAYAYALQASAERNKTEGLLSDRDSSLRELASLYARCPANEAVRFAFARTLYRVAWDQEDEPNIERARCLVTALRRVCWDFPSDVRTLAEFTSSLLVLMNFECWSGNVRGARAIAAELWRLQWKYPNSTLVRENCAQALHNLVVPYFANRVPLTPLLRGLRDLQERFPRHALIAALAKNALMGLRSNRFPLSQHETEWLRSLEGVDLTPIEKSDGIRTITYDLPQRRTIVRTFATETSWRA